MARSNRLAWGLLLLASAVLSGCSSTRAYRQDQGDEATIHVVWTRSMGVFGGRDEDHAFTFDLALVDRGGRLPLADAKRITRMSQEVSGWQGHLDYRPDRERLEVSVQVPVPGQPGAMRPFPGNGTHRCPRYRGLP